MRGTPTPGQPASTGSLPHLPCAVNDPQGLLSQWGLSPAEAQEPAVATTKSCGVPVMSWQAHVPSFSVLKEDQKTTLILGPPGQGSAALELPHLLQVQGQL